MTGAGILSSQTGEDRKIKGFHTFVGILLFASTALAQHYESGPVHVMAPWSQALPAVSKNGAVYVTLKNHGEVPDRLVGASSPIANRVEFHTHSMEGGLMTMRRVESIVLNPGEYVKVEPGGKHLMLIGLKKPLEEGGQFALTLEFAKASSVEVVVTVQALGSKGPEMIGHGHREKHDHNKEHKHEMHWQAPEHAASRRNPLDDDMASIRRGEALFQFRCTGCHGVGGRGNGPIAPVLPDKPADLVTMIPHHSDGDFAWKIRNGRGFMPAWKEVLTEDQIWDIVNYLRYLARSSCC